MEMQKHQLMPYNRLMMLEGGEGGGGRTSRFPRQPSPLEASQFSDQRPPPNRRRRPPTSRTDSRTLGSTRLPILIIDDDSDICSAIALVLEQDGFSAATAANGKEGLDLLAKLDPKPRLVLLDLWMPEMNGWDFYEHVRRDPELRSIPVIVMTAYGKKESSSLKWLRKPIDMVTLLEAVHANCSETLEPSQQR